MHSITKFLEAANQNAAAVNRKVIEITQRNLNLGFELAKSLARGAGNPSEIARVLTSFWRKQFSELATQAEEARNHFGANVAKPKMFESSPESAVEEPAKKSPTRSQKGRNQTAEDFATARLGQKAPQTPKAPRHTERASGSGVGSLHGKQPEILKRDTPKTVQKSPERDPVDEGARPQAARTKVKPGPSSTAQQRLPTTDIKFGMLDGNAVRFTNLEAWWLVDGTWRPISPDEVLSNAAVMREARFKQQFPQVPLLPKKAFQSDHR
jgi:hypothetical protein